MDSIVDWDEDPSAEGETEQFLLNAIFRGNFCKSIFCCLTSESRISNFVHWRTQKFGVRDGNIGEVLIGVWNQRHHAEQAVDQPQKDRG